MPYTPPSEFRELLDKLIDQPPLSKSEAEAFESYLADDAALKYYLHIIQQESLVGEALVAPPRARKPKSKLFIPAISAMAACACFALGLILGGGQSDLSGGESVVEKPATKGNDEFLPTITGMFGVRWAFEGENNSIIPTTNNTLQLESGIVELTYPNGVQVVLEGPASFKASGGNGGSLDFGRLVASVPPGAEGFEVNYTHGKVVDLGTEFGMDVKQNGHADIGVFDGEVEVHAPGGDDTTEVLLITENKALRHLNQKEDNILSIPFNKTKFVRHTPSREFSWQTKTLEMKELSFNVSHLIWRGARYRALFKWMHGRDAIEIHEVSLCKNGVPVVTNRQLGSTGVLGNTHNNVFELALLDDDYSRANWTIKALIAPKQRDYKDRSFEEVPPESYGIMQLVENMESNTSKEAFIGTWEYIYKGKKYIRVFKPEGKMEFGMGNRKPTKRKALWTFEDNALKLKFPNIEHTEDHVLLDENTLLFTNRPYANAVKVDEE